MTYSSVLSSRKNTVHDMKGKNAEIAKWETELKKSLATKKVSAPVSLTKQEQSLVQSQLEKEAHVRRHVCMVKSQLDRGLSFVHSVVAAAVPEFHSYISAVISLLLEGALAHKGSILVGVVGFDTYLVGNLFLS